MKCIDSKKSMFDIKNKDRLIENLNSTGLTKHQLGYDKHFFETTYKKDFSNPTEFKNDKKSVSFILKI